ncbi:MAG: response regulator, partial [Gammaproteobacteria bacterium]|nr:response regulator [Gammaproteobacteria bacterium]
VDDNNSAREVLKASVEALGLSCHTCSSGHEAIQYIASLKASSQPYPLMLIDWKMPELDGIDTCKAILAETRDDKTLTIIMVTAHRQDDARKAGAGLPISAYLTKPVTTSSLFDQIIQLCGTESVALIDHRSNSNDISFSYELAGTKVLLVEDNEMNRDMLSRRLMRKGYEVLLAVDGQQGIDMCLQAKPDLMLLDMSLPVKDGWQVAREMKASPSLQAIPIIALTAHAMADDRQRALLAGCDDYDTKPVDLPRLLGKIEQLLGAA